MTGSTIVGNSVYLTVDAPKPSLLPRQDEVLGTHSF
jgi:hypothetical protein